MIKVDALRHEIHVHPVTPDEEERARLACCAAAHSPQEACMFMKMLGLL